MSRFFPILTGPFISKMTETISRLRTLVGEFISADGVVFAGTSEAPSASLLERKAQISILSAEHSVLSAHGKRCGKNATKQWRGSKSDG